MLRRTLVVDNNNHVDNLLSFGINSGCAAEFHQTLPSPVVVVGNAISGLLSAIPEIEECSSRRRCCCCLSFDFHSFKKNIDGSGK